MKKESVTIKVNNEQMLMIKNRYQSYIVPNNGEYVAFLAKTNSLVITGYTSNKEDSNKITFIGEGALLEAQKYDATAVLMEERTSTISFWLDTDTQLGSDEVGTGDFFGPVVVCAALVTKKDIQELKELGIDDSKKLTDKHIREMVPGLLAKYRYCQLACNTEKYNEMQVKGFNMNKIKAYLHNQALLLLSNKYKGNYPTYVDQFCPESTYYEYLATAKEVKRHITFRTKGESLYPSVALASCIARYSFLLKMDALRKQYGMVFPFGASSKVDEFAERFVSKYGITELQKVCKNNFKNFTTIKNKSIF